MTAYMRAVWNQLPTPTDLYRGRASAERPRSGLHPCAHGASQEGFDAEWRTIFFYTVDGDKINRCELFDETTSTPHSQVRRTQSAGAQLENARPDPGDA